jgi:hypothetical protein
VILKTARAHAASKGAAITDRDIALAAELHCLTELNRPFHQTESAWKTCKSAIEQLQGTTTAPGSLNHPTKTRQDAQKKKWTLELRRESAQELPSEPNPKACLILEKQNW